MSEALVILVVEEVFHQPFKHILKGRYRYVRINGSSKSERPERIVTSNAAELVSGPKTFLVPPLLWVHFGASRRRVCHELYSLSG